MFRSLIIFIALLVIRNRAKQVNKNEKLAIKFLQEDFKKAIRLEKEALRTFKTANSVSKFKVAVSKFKQAVDLWKKNRAEVKALKSLFKDLTFKRRINVLKQKVVVGKNKIISIRNNIERVVKDLKQARVDKKSFKVSRLEKKVFDLESELFKEQSLFNELNFNLNLFKQVNGAQPSVNLFSKLVRESLAVANRKKNTIVQKAINRNVEKLAKDVVKKTGKKSDGDNFVRGVRNWVDNAVDSGGDQVLITKVLDGDLPFGALNVEKGLNFVPGVPTGNVNNVLKAFIGLRFPKNVFSPTGDPARINVKPPKSVIKPFLEIKRNIDISRKAASEPVSKTSPKRRSKAKIERKAVQKPKEKQILRTRQVTKTAVVKVKRQVRRLPLLVLLPKLKKKKGLRKSIDKIRSVIPSQFRPTLEAIYFEILDTEEPEKITGLEVRAIILKLARKKKNGKSIRDKKKLSKKASRKRKKA